MFTQPYSVRLKAAGRLVSEADFLLIGAGPDSPPPGVSTTRTRTYSGNGTRNSHDWD